MILWLDPRPFHTTIQGKISYYSSILLLIGIAMFMLSNGSQKSPKVQPQRYEPYKGHNLYDWISCTVAVIGLWIVVIGSFMKYWVMLNTDFDMRLHNWNQSNKNENELNNETPPKYKLMDFRPYHLHFWCSLLRLVFSMIFVFGASANFLNQVIRIPYGFNKQ
ncbi:unnamed protein product [Didymodactylos carnosus]|uniref:Uncharacterized protein n=1 Tax=Didymodactylos carnosus TaxID=1234261 RepID=A0A8S2GMK2_9BILA|nr:unnamed protein product [Didymodactylos carnosus]CAF3527648.1 unnamed protein product [Didymodactylos carnosus]